MFKKYRIIKWILISIGSLIILILGFGFWFKSLLPISNPNLKYAKVDDLSYLNENIPEKKGKVLAVVTSMDTMGESGKETGYELTELSRAYYVFQANGFEVDVASPKGGKAPVIIDDMGAYDYAFLNDSIAQHKTRNTIPIDSVNADLYKAVFFVGGKGAMFDFPKNKAIQAIVRELYQSNKVIGAVCHGPAALVNVKLDNGTYLLKNKKVSGFTNKEELLLIPKAKSIFPFLLQDKLTAQGASFNEGIMYLEQVTHDGNLITGQNPWSTWAMAETMIKQLGYTPKYREKTGEENAVKILTVYETQGLKKAKEVALIMLKQEKKPINRAVIAAHSIVATMKGELNRFFDIIKLVSFLKEKDTI